MSWLHYLIEANIYLGVFYLCYCLFLNRDTHYMLGRAYLIFSCVLAFVLPLTQASILKPVVTQTAIVVVPKHATHIAANVQRATVATPVQHITFDDVVIYLYIAGAIIAFCVLLFRLRKLYILTRNSHAMYQDRYKLINLNEENTAFSFFNYLFIGSNIPQAETIIAHELVHIRQKHSVDIIFLEIVKIVNWFNPFIYLIQRSLKTIHEYIADEQTAAQEHDALAYSSFLLNNAYGIQGSSIAHSFFNYNLLKKRIIMLNKNRSGKLARLKYLAALPLCAGMLCTSTLVFSKDYGLIDLAPRKAVAVKPVHIKYFRMVYDNIITYADNVSFTKNGITKTYKAATATNADLAYILKAHKVEIEFVMVDSKTYKPVMPSVITRDLQADTGKKKLPPPPPPAPPKPKVDKIKFPPPPPPAPPKPKVKDQVKFPPPVIKPDKPAKKLAPAVVEVSKMPPPPPPSDPVYDDLLKYAAKTTRYPSAAHDNKINGHVILSLTINDQHKIESVKIEKGIGYGCEEEAARALRTYAGTINKAPGTYRMVTTFMLADEVNNKYEAPKPLDDSIINGKNFIGETVISGML
jgi:beta-lactamase regulating signal transducer with metallopeptidase domain